MTRSRIAFALILLSTAVSPCFAQTKSPDAPAVRIPFERSLQAIVITTSDINAKNGFGRLIERRRPGAKWKNVGESFPVVVGRNGLAFADTSVRGSAEAKIKQEGDGNAPAGMFPLTSAFGINPKPDAIGIPYTRLSEFTECVDDERSSSYNRIVDRMQIGNFDWRSSEKMLSIGDAYALGVFVAYNSFPVVRGRGSCIFLHVWKDAQTATDGCTAMERQHMEKIVAWLQEKKYPYLVQFTESDYERARKTWKLPKIN